MIKTEIEQDEFERILNDSYIINKGGITSTITPMLEVNEDDDVEIIILKDKPIATREQALFYKFEN